MAIQQELWIPKVHELLYPSNAFYTHAINDTAFIEGVSVHVPVSGTQAGATRNRASFPAIIGSRTDTVTTYNINEFSADPIVVRSIEETEASYPKMTSISSQMGKVLTNSIGEYTAYEWSSNINVIDTTGSARAGYLSTQVGTRNALTYDDLLSAMRVLNAQNVPMEGRKMLIDAYLLEDLLKISEFQYSDSLMTGILTEGAIGRVLGMDVYMRTPSIQYTVGKTKILPGTAPAGTDNLGLLIWHPDFVRFALGNTIVFGSTEPTYYGDVISALARSGAVATTSVDTGVVNIIEVA